MVPNIGAAGGEQYHNGLCILTQVPVTSTHFRLFCAEHHQREDLLGALVLVRLPRPGLLYVLLLPGLHHPRL